MNFKLFLLSVATMVNAAYGETPVPVNPRVELGTAANFVILASAGITNVPTTTNSPASVITGDIAVSPIAGTSMTGFDLPLTSPNGFKTSDEVIGNVFAPEYAPETGVKLTTAASDMLIAYNNAAARPVTSGPFAGNNIGDTYSNLGNGEIGGLTLTAGVYAFGVDVTITHDDLTFRGSADDIFIIKTSMSVKQFAERKVILLPSIAGEEPPLAENIFWQVAQTVEFGEDAHMEGTFLVKTAATFITGSSLNGRILAATKVTLDHNTITETTYIPLSARRGLRGLQVA